MKALIVEDNELQSKVLAQQLTENGFACTICGNGQIALYYLLKELVDVIVSDVDMPIMDGYHLLRNVRDSPTLNNIPFVLYSSRPSNEGKELAESFGVDIYVKEAGIRGVLEAVLKILSIEK